MRFYGSTKQGDFIIIPHRIGDAAAWLLNSKHAVEAQSLLERAIPLAPEDAVLRTMLADALLELGKTEEARSFVRDYVKKHPHDVQARLDLALLYLKTGANSEALKELERLPESMRTPAVLYYEAQACRSLNRPDQAARLLRRALQKSPDFLEAMLELASIEEQLNHHAAARKLYEKLMTFDEGNQDILTRLVALSLKEGNPDRAFELASSMPDSMSFILTASALFLDEGRFDLAENLLATLAERPDAPEELLFYQAAVAYEGHRDAVRTLELLERISPSNRYYDRALKLRAQVLYENGNVDQAKAEKFFRLTRILFFSPLICWDDRSAMKRLGELRRKPFTIGPAMLISPFSVHFLRIWQESGMRPCA